MQTWSYDAAGNRSNSGYTYNNLNMMTASPGSTTYTNDILGNRLYRNPESSSAVRYGWDEAGRMTKIAGPSNGYVSSYRADGLRTKKVNGLRLTWFDNEEEASGFYDEIQNINNDTWRYRYDGQMCYEDDLTAITGAPINPVTTISGNAYTLGARGIDMIRPFSVDTSTFARTNYAAQFPIYDGHGNMTATLYRDGSGYDIANERTYDVWGGVRSEASIGTPNPNTRYCTNLGHKQDDESGTFVNGEPQGDGLIYMRARYYEPGTGRFISEDPAQIGTHWFAYASSDAVNRSDSNGEVDLPDSWLSTILDILRPVMGAELVKSVVKRVWSRGIDAVKVWIKAKSDSLLRIGTIDWSLGSAMFGETRAVGGSFWQALVASGAIRLMTRGASEIAAGLALKYIALYLEWGL